MAGAIVVALEAAGLGADGSEDLAGEPRISLEEIDGDEVVVRILATPEDSREGPRLASEVLAAIGPETRRFERDGEEQRRTTSTIPDASVEFEGGD